MISEYRSVIYYHEEKPKWCETIRVGILCDATAECVLPYPCSTILSSFWKAMLITTGSKPYLSYVFLP